MITQRNTQSVQEVDPEEGEPPRYVIDVDAADTSSRSLPALIADRRCYMCAQADVEPPADSAGEYMQRIVEHCAEAEDYLLADTPLKEAIFRVLLSLRNEPTTPHEVSDVLSGKWEMNPYPRDVSPKVIQRLMDNSESYCIVRLPEPSGDDAEETG